TTTLSLRLYSKSIAKGLFLDKILPATEVNSFGIFTQGTQWPSISTSPTPRFNILLIIAVLLCTMALPSSKARVRKLELPSKSSMSSAVFSTLHSRKAGVEQNHSTKALVLNKLNFHKS